MDFKINNTNDLLKMLKYIEKEIPINLEQIGEKVKEILRSNVKELWYERDFTPTHYTRTMELIESIVCSKARKNGDWYEVVIYYDTDRINPYPAENGEWSKHESIVTGTSSGVMLPLWVEEGQNSPLFSYEGVRPVGTTIDWLEESKFLKTRMTELLKKKGFDISYK